MRCPDDETLIALVEHALPPHELVALESHVDSCAGCRQVIATLAEAATAVGPELAAGSTPRARASGAELERGTRVGERYRIERPIGRGGMGTVYLARDLMLGRDVAVKIHRASAGRERLYKEALAMARLAHPNVVNVFEIGVVDDRRFVAMEYVSGGTSRDWLAARRTWREVVALFAEAGEGLAAAHRAGLVHRDFKPENVLVGEDGRPRVSDFGLVQEHGDSSPGSTPDPDAPALEALTETGAVVGTPAYMAPEQLDGGDVDGACDQFSFCVSVWEALHGVRPFAGATTAEIQAAIVERQLRPVARGQVPARVRRVLERGLAAEPRERYPDMPALLAAIRRAARPRTARWSVLAATAVATLAGVTALVADRVAHHRHEEVCAAAGARVRSQYGSDVRAKIATAFAATGVPYAASAADRAGAVLDRYAGALATRTAAACSDEQPAPIATARAKCLADRADELVAIVKSFEHADRRIVDNAPEAAWSLADPAPCDDIRALLAAPPVQLPAEDTAPLLDARIQLATGNYAAGIALARPVYEAAKVRGDRPAELTALHVLAQLQTDAGPADVAKRELRDEIALAEQLGDDLSAAAAHSALASIAASDSRDFEEAHRELELARAKLVRLGGGNQSLDANLLSSEGQILAEEFRFGEADKVLHRATAVLEQIYGPDHPKLAMALGSLNQALVGEGAFADALAAIRRSLEIFERALGADHPVVGGAWLTEAQTLMMLDRFDEAREAIRHADAIFVRTVGADHVYRAQAAGVLGQIELSEHHGAAALDAYRRELAIIEKIKGPESGFAGSIHHDIAATLASEARYDEAVVEERRSLAILERTLDKDDTELASPLGGIADALIALHRPAEAIGFAERALALTTNKPGFDPAQAVPLQMTIATARWDRGERAQARELANLANKTEGEHIDHAAIAAWLAAHR